MVNEKIERVLEVLHGAGIQAIRGYPGSKIQAIINPIVAVSLERYTDQVIALSVDVFGSTERDGIACEELAIRIEDLLKGEMALCTVGNCAYSGKTGLFTVRVLAQWYRELEYAVEINDEAISHVISCRAEKNTVRVPYVTSAAGDVLTTVERNEWAITVTDVWPLNQKMPAEQEGTFRLFVMRPGGLEEYMECSWSHVTREETPAGVLRTRVAKTYQDPVPGAG